MNGEAERDLALLEWFKSEVVVPLDNMKDQITRLDQRFTAMDDKIDGKVDALDRAVQAHHDGHESWVSNRRTVEKWIIRGLGAIAPVILLALLANALGVSV